MLSHITGTIGQTVPENQKMVPTKTIPEKQPPADIIPVAKPIIEPKDPKWDQDNVNVMKRLLNSMEPQISRLFMYYESAREIWDETKEMFGQEQNFVCFAYIFHIKQEISQIKQGTKIVTEYYGDLKVKWDELALYTTTTDLRALEQEKVFQFFSGLDPSYEPVRSQIFLSKELSKLRAVVATVQREESHHALMNPYITITEQENHAFVGFHHNPNPRAENQGAKTIKCDNCKKDGHSKDECWFLHLELRPKRKEKGGDDRHKKKGGGNRADREKRGMATNQEGPDSSINETGEYNQTGGHKYTTKGVKPVSMDFH
jgi:Retrotransposon gag protein